MFWIIVFQYSTDTSQIKGTKKVYRISYVKHP